MVKVSVECFTWFRKLGYVLFNLNWVFIFVLILFGCVALFANFISSLQTMDSVCPVNVNKKGGGEWRIDLTKSKEMEEIKEK